MKSMSVVCPACNQQHTLLYDCTSLICGCGFKGHVEIVAYSSEGRWVSVDPDAAVKYITGGSTHKFESKPYDFDDIIAAGFGRDLDLISLPRQFTPGKLDVNATGLPTGSWSNWNVTSMSDETKSDGNAKEQTVTDRITEVVTDLTQGRVGTYDRNRLGDALGRANNNANVGRAITPRRD